MFLTTEQRQTLAEVDARFPRRKLATLSLEELEPLYKEAFRWWEDDKESTAALMAIARVSDAILNHSDNQ